MNDINVNVLLYRILQKLRIEPSIWVMRNPFKIYEFFVVLSGASLEKRHVVLDLGCGRGFQAQVLARYCKKVVGIDIDKKEITNAKKFLHGSCIENKVELICASLMEADLPESSLDRVFSFCVLEHISNPRTVLQEIVRLLKPGGELHISVDSLAPISSPTLLAKHREDHHVAQYFTKESLKQEIEAIGLEVLEIVPILTSQSAIREFEEIIMHGGYQAGIMRSILVYTRLRIGDLISSNTKGIMLVGRARKSNWGSND